ASLLRRGVGTVDAAHADAHESDAREVDAVIARAEMVEQRGNDRRPVRSDREARRVLTLTGAVDRERRHPAAQELVLDGEELLLHRIESGDEQYERRPRGAEWPAQDARDHGALERRFDALARGIEPRER